MDDAERERLIRALGEAMEADQEPRAAERVAHQRLKEARRAHREAKQAADAARRRTDAAHDALRAAGIDLMEALTEYAARRRP